MAVWQKKLCSVMVFHASNLTCFFLRVLLRILLGKKKADELLEMGLVDLEDFRLDRVEVIYRRLAWVRRWGVRPINKEEGLVIENESRYITPLDMVPCHEEVKNVYLMPEKGDVVFDVGANYGFYTLQASRLVGSDGLILAFEPHPDTYKGLLTNLSLNNVRNVRTFNVAVGEFDGHVRLYIHTNSGECSTYRKSKRWIDVESTKLDTIVERLGITVNLIKIDVEGAELDVLKGARKTLKKFHPKLTIAAYHFPDQAAQINDWLKGLHLSYDMRIVNDEWMKQMKLLPVSMRYFHAAPSSETTSISLVKS